MLVGQRVILESLPWDFITSKPHFIWENRIYFFFNFRNKQIKAVGFFTILCPHRMYVSTWKMDSYVRRWECWRFCCYIWNSFWRLITCTRPFRIPFSEFNCRWWFQLRIVYTWWFLRYCLFFAYVYLYLEKFSNNLTQILQNCWNRQLVVFYFHTFYHNKSPLNHHLGKYVVHFFPNHVH